MLESYRANPNSDTSFYDLRIGYGGHQGSLTNIGADGFASMSFHSFPETLEWDSYSGDYGLNFVGQVLGAGTYLVKHPVFGWVCFGGNIVSEDEDRVSVEPRDAVRQRIYIAPVGLYVTVDAGAITRFTLSGRQLTVELVDVADGTGAERAKEAKLEFTSSVSARLIADGLNKTTGQVFEYESGHASLVFAWG